MNVTGFRAGAFLTPIDSEDTDDVAVVVSNRPAAAAGIFTVNAVQAAPVYWDRSLLARGGAVRAVVANSGNANACTGEVGLANARAMAERVAARLSCAPEEVLVLSTGVIGVPLVMDRLLPRIDGAVARLRVDGWQDAATAMMTTDRRPKLASASDPAFSLAGIAKGAGMIAPHMATMLAVIVTDAPLTAAELDEDLRLAADASFHRIVVDGDMSTNDTVLLLANGASERPLDAAARQRFRTALTEVSTLLAREIVADGEGATKLVRIEVGGASDEASARKVAHAISISPLCKTAFWGADPNWGRIASSAGAAGVPIDPTRLSVTLAAVDGTTMPLFRDGLPLPFDEAAASERMREPEWTIQVDLGVGEASWWSWTCDLTPAYVTLNGHYRT